MKMLFEAQAQLAGGGYSPMKLILSVDVEGTTAAESAIAALLADAGEGSILWSIAVRGVVDIDTTV